jgi:hypothetical protein
MGIDAIYLLYIAGAATAAASSVVQARAVAETEELRQTAIKNEVRQEQLNAEQEEITRRQELSLANADVIVNSGNIDPFGSQSLLALRRFNLKNTERDVRNIKINLSLIKGQASNEILASRRRAEGAKTAGILNAGSSIIGSTAAGLTFRQNKALLAKANEAP